MDLSKPTSGNGRSTRATPPKPGPPGDPLDQLLLNYLARTGNARSRSSDTPDSEAEEAETQSSDPTGTYQRKVRKRYQAAIFRSYWVDLDGHLKQSPVEEHREVLDFIGLFRGNANKGHLTGETDPYNFFVSLVATRTELRRSGWQSGNESIPFPVTGEILCEAACRLIEFTRNKVVEDSGTHRLSPAEFACLTLLARRGREWTQLLLPGRLKADHEAVGRLVAEVEAGISIRFPGFAVTAEGLVGVWKGWGMSYSLFLRGIPFKWRFLRAAA